MLSAGCLLGGGGKRGVTGEGLLQQYHKLKLGKAQDTEVEYTIFVFNRNELSRHDRE